MMNQEKNNSRLLKHNIVLGMAALTFGYFLLPLILSVIIADWISTCVTLPILFVNGIITCLVFLIVFTIYKERLGFYTVLNTEQHNKFPDFFYLGSEFLFFLLYLLLQLFLSERKISCTIPSMLNAAGSALSAGFSEELFFRGVLLTYLVKRFEQNPNRFQVAVIISTLVFAFAHSVNMTFSDYSIEDLIYQVFSTFCLGLFLCSLFLQTSSLWQCVVIHATWNFFIFISNALFGASVVSGINTCLYLVFEIFMGCFGWILIRRRKF